MTAELHHRPDSDTLLLALREEEKKTTHGRLKIFFGMSAGVGKTYEMLRSAHEAKSKGIDIVIGFVETHQRSETEALVRGLETIPRRIIEYRGISVGEMDLDALLQRRPKIAVVDELAHTNAPTSRHAKRYQDVLELLDNGIDVYTTVNVQHLESRADAVAQISGAVVRETVPDSIFDQADEVELIDISPEDLLKRLEEGKVYAPDRSQRAIENFFRVGNLTALREMALRLTAERVDHQLRDYRKAQRITEPWKSGQRLLVGISPSPSTVSVIRWARRMAYAMNATWIGVYVESSTPLSDAAKTQLNSNIKLARDLGAEIITTADERIASALIRTARHNHATQILIGKSSRRPVFRTSLPDEVIEQSGTLDVVVIGDHERNPSKRRWFSLPEIQSGLQQYGIASLIVLLMAVVCYPLAGMMGYQTVALVLLLTVALLPLKLGVGPVLLAATLSALIWNYFFIPPHFTFEIGLLQDALMFVMYFAIATVTSVLTARIRAREKAVRVRESHSTALYTLTKQLTAANNQDEVAAVAVSNIAAFFNAEVAVFFCQQDGDIFTAAHPRSMYAVDEKEFSVAAWVYWNERKAGKHTETLPFAGATYYPVTGPRYPLGVVGVRERDGRPFSIDQDSLLQNFIAQIASTLEREQLNELARRTVVFEESEKLYKTLFNSISHELRTPIAAIINASDTLELESAPGTARRTLAEEIRTAAERLHRLVENLLDMNRLESGQLAPRMDWCDIRDIVNTATKKLEKDLSRHPVAVDIGNDVPLIKLDFGLTDQAIANLLRNSSQYTPEGTRIGITARKEKGMLRMTIDDDGPGFPPEALRRLFQKFYRIPGTKPGGTGLGLSIAKGFIEAQKGTIKVSNRPSGGASFEITLPL